MNCYEDACRLLPRVYKDSADRFGADKVEEFRLRTGRKLSAVRAGQEYELAGETISEKDILYALELATDASIHRFSEELSQGYISRNGLRIGVCGQPVITGGKIIGFHSYSSLCIRIPHRCEGVCSGLYERICSREPSNILLVSPPGAGKTTALRDLIRILADGGVRVGIVDERNELSGGVGSQAGFPLGRCSDVLAGLSKSDGAMMLLRGMDPQVIAMDEISRPEDVKAIYEISGCGVNILATAHGKSKEDMLSRPVYRELMKTEIFDWIVFIRIVDGRRIYEEKRLKE